jgi:chromosome partitioning protein
MYKVAMLSQKGGTGKTTTTLNLATAATLARKSVVVIDLDPQASAAGWKDSRETEEPVVVASPASRLEQALKAAEQGGAEFVFIDTAPHDSEVALAAAEAADIILIPCRPGILDLRAIGTTARAVRLSGKPAFIVLNAMTPRAPNMLADVKAAVAVHKLPISPAILHQRAAYAHSLTLGQTAQEYEPDGKASDEIENLFKWLSCELEKVTARLPARRQSSNAATRDISNRAGEKDE